MPTAAENLHWIQARWNLLAGTRLRGTARPWKEPTLTPEQRARLDAEARAEKRERGAFVLGESPAPIHLDILDQLQDVARRLRTLALAVDLETNTVTPALHKQPDYRNVPAYLDYLTWQLPATTEAARETITRTTGRIRAEIAASLAEVFDGKRLKTDCPWCGQPKMFVRLAGGEPLIVCESGTCEPPDADCGTTYRGKPAWPIHEWDWLANRINYNEHQALGRYKTS